MEDTINKFQLKLSSPLVTDTNANGRYCRKSSIGKTCELLHIEDGAIVRLSKESESNTIQICSI